jgi:2-phosphosulfolactate phosphatase
MRVDVCFGVPSPVPRGLLVVVDVFRSSSAIIEALSNGAREVISFTNTAKAIHYLNSINHDRALLVGERNGITPKGFDLNISPFDLSRKNVEGRTILYTSTNLTRVLGRLGDRNGTAIGGFNNARAVAKHLERIGRDVSIVACGDRRGPTIEDLTGAGAIAASLRSGDFTDRALLAAGMYGNPQWASLVKKGRIAERLLELGLKKDVEFCIGVDTATVVPVARGNRIIRAE